MTLRRFLTPMTVPAALAACLMAGSALAQSSTRMEGMALSNDKPIQIESDQLEIQDTEKKAYFTGNVRVVQGATTMRAGKMTVVYLGEGSSVTSGNTQIDKIFLNDTVHLTSGQQNATADQGEFVMASQTFVLTGKQVVLSDGPNVFRGCKLTVLMKTGEAKLTPCSGTRVQILLDPKSKPQQ
ncbi:lipopolysaccharide export system protein LptA [Neorhizobium huautlense]|uniref:Lipopolysaccharide export system protein LptA n=2 Tax=Neorhizobium huautlense TaxID=67774 RepID=A0ABT9PY18_9HYPH|nr:LptA/OstA family protein [Neorhizobium huautlense]MDP9839378.1 lipopolysaccharide export system protein LptA [Neorhizobium huautlense]